MPSAAAALVTSPSLAAPSSIEYSVCTCRCTKFSDEAGLLTVRGAPHGSCGRLPPAGGQGRRVVLGDRRGRPFRVERALRVVLPEHGAHHGRCRPGVGAVPGVSILAPPEVYPKALTVRVPRSGPLQEGPPAPHHSHARGGTLQGASQSGRHIVTWRIPASSYSPPAARYPARS